MKLVNLTPHAINILDKDGANQLAVIEPSGVIARHDDKEIYIEERSFDRYLNIPLLKAESLSTKGLPESETGVVFIVSTPVRIVLKDRNDIASPGELIRNEFGQPIGCKGLIFNSTFFE